ncbi:MAG: GTPase HflX, partial [Caldilineaceae bacterium]|nr:GTPase HflX [Caldilineaceae bacterium]
MTNPNSFKSEVSSADQQAEGRSRQTVARDEAGLVSTAPVEERAVLVGVELQREPSLLTLEDSLDELALLAKTAGVKSVARLTQRLDTPNPATLIGSGKLEELKL